MRWVCRIVACLVLILSTTTSTRAQQVSQVRDGMVVVEAEDFVLQTADQTRRWYLVNASNDGLEPIHIPVGTPQLPERPEPDPDRRHATRAVGGTYLKILPDTRRTHEDPLHPGINFSNAPGLLGILSYTVDFDAPGRYFVWVRAYSTGTEDNGVHVGLDGQWPASGQRMQWCNGKNAWYWENSQRTTANSCGEPRMIYLDVATAGQHTVQFSMREDGFEMDRWLLTTDQNLPHLRREEGPDANPYRQATTAIDGLPWARIKEPARR